MILIKLFSTHFQHLLLNRRSSLFISFLFFCLSLLFTHEAKGVSPFINHGTAVPVARSFGDTVLINDKGERLMVVWLGDHSQGVRNLLVLNFDTEETLQIPVEIEHWGTTRAFLLSSQNRLYAQYAYRFFEFCPNELKFLYVEDVHDRRSFSIFEDQHGIIWVAQSFGAHLLSFNPETQDLTDHGSLNSEDWNQYLRSIAGDEAGWIYVGIEGVRSQIAGYHSISGEVRYFIPETEREAGRPEVILAVDSEVYARKPTGEWIRLSGGEVFSVEGTPPEAISPQFSMGTLNRTFKDGSRVTNLDLNARKVFLESKEGNKRAIDFDYKTGGARLYSLVLGPDESVYGGSGHPTHIFRYDIAESSLKNSLEFSSGGHFNALFTKGSEIFAARYIGGGLYRFDPSAQWNPGATLNNNPGQLSANARPEIVRPTDLIFHAHTKTLVLAGSPRGGRTAGGLFLLDLKSQEFELISHEDLLENLNTLSLVELPNGLIVGATTTNPGTGGERRATEAELYLFDPNSRRIIWNNAILPGEQELRDIVLGYDGFIYGISGESTLFIFDPDNRRLIHHESLAEYGAPAGSQAPRLMEFDENGFLFILFRESIVAFNPETRQHQLLSESPETIDVGIVVFGGKIYFTTSTDLWSFKIPYQNMGEFPENVPQDWNSASQIIIEEGETPGLFQIEDHSIDRSFLSEFELTAPNLFGEECPFQDPYRSIPEDWVVIPQSNDQNNLTQITKLDNDSGFKALYQERRDNHGNAAVFYTGSSGPADFGLIADFSFSVQFRLTASPQESIGIFGRGQSLTWGTKTEPFRGYYAFVSNAGVSIVKDVHGNINYGEILASSPLIGNLRSGQDYKLAFIAREETLVAVLFGWSEENESFTQILCSAITEDNSYRDGFLGLRTSFSSEDRGVFWRNPVLRVTTNSNSFSNF